MSLKWPLKDPDELLDYSLDWSRYLGDNTINSVRWYIEDASGVKTLALPGETVDTLTLTSQSTTGTVSTALFSNGTANNTYRVTCEITFGPSSLVASRTVQLPVKER